VRLAYRHARTPLRGHRLLVALSVAAVVVAGCGLGGALVYRHLQGNIRALDVTAGLGDDRPAPAPSGDADRGPLNILVIGSDTRAGENGFIGGDDKDAGRSDTTILLHVAADRGSAYGVSIPRDSMVEMPDCAGENGRRVAGGVRPFNDAYTIGGPACTIRTVEQLTRVRVDHYVVADFAGFTEMVDALGGVEICLPRPVHDARSKIDLPAGRTVVDGTEALGYVRIRHGIGDGGDLGRVARQQAFISAVLQKATSAGTLSNPAKLYSFLDTATRSLTVDPGLASLTSLASLGREIQSIGLDRIRFLTVPTTEYPPDPDRLQWAPSAALVWRALRQDRPIVAGSGRTPRHTATPTPTPASSSGPVDVPGLTDRTAATDVCS
jgi:LCP family protein required for cell wall assembly